MKRNPAWFGLLAFFIIIAWRPANNNHSATPLLSTVYPAVSGKQAPDSQPVFLFISDIHLDHDNTGSQFGDDTGTGLWQMFLTKIESILAGPNSPRFILYTGDIPAHYGTYFLPPGGRTDHDSNMVMVLGGLRKLSTRYQKPLFYLPGNNDALAGDYFPFGYGNTYTPFSLLNENTNPYPALNINPGTNQPPCMVSQPDTSMAFYSAYPVKGLRLIALNTVMYTNSAFKAAAQVGVNPDDYTQKQMDWLNQELSDATAKKEKVYIAMHVPPGMNVYGSQFNPGMWTNQLSPGQQKTWDNQFLLLIEKYQSSIAGIMYGHTHMDELRRLYDSANQKITAVAISCPGITPYYNNNPGFKTVSYDSTHMDLLDYTTHYYSLNNAGTVWGNSSYTFSETYKAKPNNNNIYQQISTMKLKQVTQAMMQVFKVKNGQAGSKIQKGIEVKYINQMQ